MLKICWNFLYKYFSLYCYFLKILTLILDQDSEIRPIFREKIFIMLQENNRISDKLIKTMRHWKHSGFSVDNSIKIEKDDYDSMLRLAQYIVHTWMMHH